MRITRSRDYAIVTGDMVGSSKLPAAQRRELHAAMSRASDTLVRAFGKQQIPAPVGIFRGDGWQLLVSDPARSLRSALFYRAAIRAGTDSRRTDTRLAIAIGSIDFLPGDRVAEGDGAAYRLSGALLESMGRKERMRLAAPDHPAERSLQVMVGLIDGLVTRWSDKQATAILGALQDWNQEKIARKLWTEPISQQAVAQHLDRAGWSHLEPALIHIEELLARRDK